MPWKETCPMDQRREFIKDYLRGLYSKKDLCSTIQPTHRRQVDCFMSHGLEGLCERSRPPGTPAPRRPRSPSASWR